MLRSAATATVVLVGGAIVAVVLSLLTLRLVFTAVIALTGIRRRTVHDQVLSW